MNISVIGTGYVGLVTGVCFADHGHQVICVDIDQEKVDLINKGIPPIYEDGLKDLLQKVQKNLKATTSYKEALYNSDITFISVGTPSNENGSIDLKYVKKAAETIGVTLKNKEGWHTVVVKSTVIPGTTQNSVQPLLEKHSGKKAGKDFGVAMNPEFLREGIAIKDFMEPDRVVIGTTDEKSKNLLKQLYQPFNCPMVETTPTGAEMIKYASNAFLATKISFINELGNLCKKLNIDTYDVADGMGLDNRIERSFLNAGIGWGGSCFPKDVHALIAQAQEWHEPTPLMKATVERNNLQPLKLIELLKKHVPQLKGKTIGVLGLAFKPNTDDIRDSRAIPIIEQLLKEQATVKAYDPQAMDHFKTLFPSITYCAKADEVLESDAVLLTTAWNEFSTLDFSTAIVIDGRRFTPATKAKIYEGVCW